MFSTQLLGQCRRSGIALILQLLRQLVVVKRIVAFARLGAILALNWPLNGLLISALIGFISLAAANEHMTLVNHMRCWICGTLAREATVATKRLTCESISLELLVIHHSLVD